ncbi:CDP-glycerol glycerophosphotransferase family protein [Vibrio sp. PNB22_4_2]
MRSVILRIVSFLFNGANYLVPKVKQRTVFCGTPDFDDMLRGLIPHIEHEDVYVLTQSNSPPPKWVPESMEVINKHSLYGIYLLITSSKVYFTHGIFSFFKLQSQERQKVINLWHGMPIKNIGLLDKKTKVPSFHFSIATSELFKEKMANAFGVHENKIIVTGLPRNNLLKLEVEKLSIIDELSGYEKFFLWLPTYRKADVGDKRVDSKSSSLVGSDDFDFEAFDLELKKNRIVVYIKPHPMAIYKKINDDYTNIKIIDDQWIRDRDSSLYELLSITNGLITDYSSVAIDYMVTGNPIISYCPDFEEYNSSRGFAIEILDLASHFHTVSSQSELMKTICSKTIESKYEKDINNYNTTKGFDERLF